MSGSGRETLPDIPEWWEALLDVREWLGGPLGHPVVVNWPSWMPKSGRETLPDVQELSGEPSGYPGVVGRPSQISGSGWEVLLDIAEWSGGHPGCPGVDERPSRMSLSGGRLFRISWCSRKVIPNVRKW